MRLVLEGAAGAGEIRARRELVAEVAAGEYARRGVAGADAAAIGRSMDLLAWPLVQGIVGWAGRPDDVPLVERRQALRLSSFSAA